MIVREILNAVGARAVTGEAGLDNEVKCGYACDLLSWVMAHGSEGMAWVTVQTHMNVIAVATLHDMSCVIIPENAQVDEEVSAKAAEEGVAILLSEKSAYEICALMHDAGVPAGEE